ncbi:GLPGLI family protein [Winogradskyella wandonensis]|uniref:GLPGLI family protein n=1 Tax=Winogradskyella wandonensis TaxID=1442586 RepID=A0A4R1KUU2_9FLAO|nr:hypothetical protein [Winogradskyella wandonensis]TCK67979.1 GLPGLI family protein [Winogradskyella wandonensis]
MKLIYSLILTACFTFAGLAQTGFYVKYNTDIQSSDEDAEMVAAMMQGSTIEVAANADKSWIQTNMGTMMTMTLEMDVKQSEATIYLTGMVGKLAYRGDPETLKDNDEDEGAPEIQFINETKDILGITCKKAISKDDSGNTSTFWYTENFKRPEGMEQMPTNVPGLCLEFSVKGEGFLMTYKAVEFNDNAQMADYKLEIPADVKIQKLEDMKNMGLGN